MSLRFSVIRHGKGYTIKDTVTNWYDDHTHTFRDAVETRDYLNKLPVSLQDNEVSTFTGVLK